MSTTDWIVDIALILVVFRQLRAERLTLRTILLPFGILAWAASQYLHQIPTAGNDLLLIGGFTAIGAAFGLFGGLATQVRFTAGRVYVKATAMAAGLWVTSMSLRLAFAVWSSHHSGLATLTHFSAIHDITSGQAWVTGLIFMAFGEVIVRLGLIVARGQLLAARHGTHGPLTLSANPRTDAYA
jgi:hypothetical protein